MRTAFFVSVTMYFYASIKLVASVFAFSELGFFSIRPTFTFITDNIAPPSSCKCPVILLRPKRKKEYYEL